MDIDGIIDRLRQVHGAKNDAQLVQVLDLGKSAVSNWRFRKHVPVDICFETACSHGVSMDWLIFGVGERGQSSPDTASFPALKQNPVVEGAPAADRLVQFVHWWHFNRSQDEMIWLEQQFKRAVPEYGEWTTRLSSESLR